jgi:hypothetical protein
MGVARASSFKRCESAADVARHIKHGKFAHVFETSAAASEIESSTSSRSDRAAVSLSFSLPALLSSRLGRMCVRVHGYLVAFPLLAMSSRAPSANYV